MQKRVFVHAGLPKSGTSFLQAVLAANKKQLKQRARLLYPGDTWSHQVWAVRDLREMKSPDQRRQVRGAWGRLAEEINAWPGDAVVSMEWLGAAKAEHVGRLVRDLQSARVEAIFTARDLGRTIPGAWQESIQNQNEWTWREFLDGVTAEDPQSTPTGRQFWRLQDIGKILDTWGTVLPPEQMHVVTVPRPGSPPAALWERFCEVLGFDGRGYVVEGVGRNTSLGVESAEMLRRLNGLSREAEITRERHRRVLTRGLAKHGLALHSTEETRLTLPSDVHDWVRQRADRQIDEIRAAGVHLVGDLDELKATLPPEVGRQPEDMDEGVLLKAALDALVILTQQSEAGHKRAPARHERKPRRMTKQATKLRRRVTRGPDRIRALGGRRRRGRRRTGTR